MEGNLSVVVVGFWNVHFIAYCETAPLVGQTILGTDFKKGFGGKGANQVIKEFHILCICQKLMDHKGSNSC